MWAIAETTVDDALAPLSPLERTRFAGLASRVKEQLQSLAGADLAVAPAAPALRARAGGTS